MGMKITRWHVGMLEPKATTPSWATAEGSGGAGGSTSKWLPFQIHRKGTLTTQGLLTNSGRLGGGGMERILSKKPSFVIFK